MENSGMKAGRVVIFSISKALLYFIAIGVIIPLVVGALIGTAGGKTLAMIFSTFVLQAASPPVGIASGLSPPFITLILICFATGLVLAIYEICEGLASSSAKIRKWIDKLGAISQKYPIIKKYGAISCLFIAWIPGVGLYGTPVIAWILQWKKIPSLIFTVTGFVIAGIFVMFFATKINEVLLFASYAGIIISAILGMMAFGLTYTPQKILECLEDRKLLILAILLNLVLVPIVAYIFITGFKLPVSLAAGLLLMGVAAGVPFLPRPVWLGNENVAVSASIAIVLVMISAIIVPSAIYLAFPGTMSSLIAVYAAIILCIIVPFIAGLLIRPRKEKAAIRYAPWLSKISYVAIVASVVAVFLVYFEELPKMVGTYGFIAAIAIILIGFGAGWLCGLGKPSVQKILAFGTAQRNIAVAAIIAVVGFADHAVLVMTMVIMLAGLIILVLLGRIIRRKKQEGTGTTTPS